MIEDRPILCLDIDEVLNLTNGSGNPDWVWDPQFLSTTDPMSGRQFPLVLSREMGTAIAELGCEIQWLTTWTDHANPNVGAHFGWEEKPVAGRPKFSEALHGSPNWKGRAVSRLREENPGRLIIWIDDRAEEICWNYPVIKNDPLILVLTPKVDVGITRKMLRQIRYWVADKYLQHFQSLREEG